MKATFYILSIFILFVSIILASESGWEKRYPERWQSRLYTILTEGFDKESVRLQSMRLLPYIDSSEGTVGVQKVLKDVGKTPLDLYSILIETLHPDFAGLSRDYYKEQRDSSGVSDEFNEFDANFCKKLYALSYLFYTGVNWKELEGLSSKEEVMCEAAFFYGLIDFKRAITCLDAVPPAVSLTPKIFANFVADMYFGEASRPDFSYEGDVETRKWLDGMVIKYKGSQPSHTSSLMRRFTRDIRGKVDDKLWSDYMRAMMTVHLSAVILHINRSGLKDLYDYLANNRIQDEYIFASVEWDPLQPGQTVQRAHAFLRTFKLDPNGETATMGLINSGEGLQFHDKTFFHLSELPDTISKDPSITSVTRYIPFIVYDAVPRSAWGHVYTIVDSMDKAYFEQKQKKHIFDNHQRWQYIDDQRAGTCSAMSLWNALYWFERESQQKLESFRLALYLEVLKEAAKELHNLRMELRKMDDQLFEMVDVDPGRYALQKEIDEKGETEDDYLRFFSVGFNSAIRSIRYLHYDPFKQGLNMTSIMQDYADFYESQAGEGYWQLVKPNIDDLFHSTYLRVVKPMIWVTPLSKTKISAEELACVDEVNQAIKVKSPLSFVKAIVRGSELKCQSRRFLASIYFGVDGLDLKAHHQDLILRALAKEIRSLSGGKLSVLKLAHRLINDYNFKLFPSYDVPKSASIDFTKESHQVVLFKDDTEMKQFAVNCTAFDLLAKNILAASNDLVGSAVEAIFSLGREVDPYDIEEHKLHGDLVQHAANELQSMDPHIYAQYFGNLIENAAKTGIVDHLQLFKPSNEWNRDDYELLLRATEGGGPAKTFVKDYIDDCYNLTVGRALASQHLPSLPSGLSDNEYICAGKVSRAISADSPLDFVKAIAFGAYEGCKSELYPLSITLGIEALKSKLQPYHQDLILRVLVWHENAPQMLEFVNKLITKYGFKLFSTDNTPPTANDLTAIEFFWMASKLEHDFEARQFAANLDNSKSIASIILATCAEHPDLAGLRLHFVDHVFEELLAMNPHLHAYHLSGLIRQIALKPEDIDPSKLSKEWNDYDYVLIESAVISDPQREEYDKIFDFPKEYHIDTENVRDESEFDLMGTNPSDETLQEYATMLFNKMKDSYRK